MIGDLKAEELKSWMRNLEGVMIDEEMTAREAVEGWG